MRKDSFLPGLLLLLFGAYFLLQQLNLELWEGLFSWSTLLVIIGFALLLQSYKQQDHANILPGIVLLGVGLHFQLKNQWSFWPDHFAVIILIAGIGFVLRSQKTKTGLLEGIVLLGIACFFLFWDSIMEMLGIVEFGFSAVYTYWPAILIALGIYLLFIKKNR